jgi:serine/threonine-protein kinase PRP4
VGWLGLSQPELLAVADDGPPEAQELIPSVGASGIDFTQAREIRKQEEENTALSKALEARIATDTKEKTKGPMDLKSIKEKMAEDLEKARRALDQAQKEAEEKKQQEEEYYKASLGEPCGPDDRFVIIDELGKGEFASVFKCRDKEVRGSDGAFLEYAIKFTRKNENLKTAMDREIIMLGNICTQAVSLDAEGSRHILGLMFLNGFEHEDHLCCVYELMKCDMRMAMQRYTTGGGFPLYPTIRSLSRQLLLALRALVKCQILHCDVKPDNILLSPDRETIKLSDFGSAIEDSERKRTEYLQPRHYRCPEIILGQTYSTQVDVWSAGCTIYELATGKSLFVGEHNNAMIHEYLKLWGPFSKHFATVGHFASKHFKEENCDFLNANGDFLVGTTNPAVLPMSHFEPPPRSLKVGIDAIAKPSGLEPKRFEALKGFLATLIRKCCMVDPAERATPEEALRNKLFEPGAGL